MDILDLIGKSKQIIESTSGLEIVAKNNVNCTIEVKGITTSYDDLKHHVLLFFDIANNNVMTLAILKLEKLTTLHKAKLLRLRNMKCGEYICNITFSNKHEAMVTYIRESIFRAI